MAEPLTPEEEQRLREAVDDLRRFPAHTNWVNTVDDLLATLDAERATRATTLPVDLAGALARAQHTVNLQVGGCDHSGGVGDCEDTVRELLRLAAIHSTPAPEIDVEALARALVKVFGPANGAYGGVQAQRDAADIAAEYARQRKGTPQEDAS